MCGICIHQCIMRKRGVVNMTYISSRDPRAYVTVGFTPPPKPDIHLILITICQPIMFVNSSFSSCINSTVSHHSNKANCTPPIVWLTIYLLSQHFNVHHLACINQYYDADTNMNECNQIQREMWLSICKNTKSDDNTNGPVQSNGRYISTSTHTYTLLCRNNTMHFHILICQLEYT
jgi:hypothetical protein